MNLNITISDILVPSKYPEMLDLRSMYLLYGTAIQKVLGDYGVVGDYGLLKDTDMWRFAAHTSAFHNIARSTIWHAPHQIR